MRILYLNDYIGTIFDTPEREVDTYNKHLIRNGFPAAERRENGEAFFEQFDALIFDWGMAQFGNSMLEALARYLARCAQENPSRLFYIRSAMSEWAIHEAERELGGLLNIFYDEEQFFDALRKKQEGGSACWAGCDAVRERDGKDE